MKELLFRIILKIQKELTALLRERTVRNIKKELKSVGKNFSVGLPVYTHGLKNIEIGDNFRAGERLKLRTFTSWGGETYSPIIKIGNNASIETDCHISAINSIIIEDNVLLASFVYISDHSHGEITEEELDLPPLERKLYSKGGIRICSNVWIGEKVTVLPGVTIGENSIIGANSVVTHDVPSNCIAAGVPARVIRKI